MARIPIMTTNNMIPYRRDWHHTSIYEDMVQLAVQYALTTPESVISEEYDTTVTYKTIWGNEKTKTQQRLMYFLSFNKVVSEEERTKWRFIFSGYTAGLRRGERR